MRKKLKSMVLIVSILCVGLTFTIDTKNYLVGSTEKNQVKDNSGNHNPILFLHGHTKSWSTWYKMMVWFKDEGWSNTTEFYSGYAYDFHQPMNCTTQSIIVKANQVKEWVDDILTETGAEKIDIVGHSMGGHVGRYYVKFLDGFEKVDDFVTLGSPHHGFNLNFDSFCGDRVQYFIDLNNGDETPRGNLNDTLGEKTDAVTGVKYNGSHIPGNINYTSIYSQADQWVEEKSCLLDGANNVHIGNILHSDFQRNETVFKLVKAAVDDSPSNGATTPATTFPAITAIFAMGLIALIMLYRRRL
ncbi:MAG: lipase family alpha/beta hydrolase [Candidatus Hodarchaeales archaeon]|jgi:triacylglycerol lipase